MLSSQRGAGGQPCFPCHIRSIDPVPFILVGENYPKRRLPMHLDIHNSQHISEGNLHE